MLKKEILDTLKQTGLILSFLLIMPLVFAANQTIDSESQLSFSWYIIWGMSFLLPILMLYLSYMMFASEDSEGAAEYLKSLPLSKWKLLSMKVIPRLIIISTTALIYSSIFNSNFVHIGNFAWFYLEIRPLATMHTAIVIILPLVFGFMLGISDRNNIFLAFSFLLTICYFIFSEINFMSQLSRKIYRLWWSVFPNTDIHHFFELDSFLRVFLPTLLPVLVLIPIFKSWDASSGKIRGQRMLKRMAGPLALIIALFAFDHLHLFLGRW